MKQFEVLKGCHYSRRKWPKIYYVKQGFLWERTFVFDPAKFVYDCGNNIFCLEQVNKFGGITIGLNPKKNSIRLGFNVRKLIKGKVPSLTIYSFIHDKGVMKINALIVEWFDKPFELRCKLEVISRGLCRWTLTNKTSGVVATFIISVSFKVAGFAYNNNLYFGGEIAAPNDIVLPYYDENTGAKIQQALQLRAWNA